MHLTTDEKLMRLQRALDYAGPTHAVSDMVRLVREGKAQFWEHGDGMIFTELLNFPLVRAVNYWLLAGHLPDVLALDERITSWAIGEGCTIGIATGRKGWGRAGAPCGWKPWSYTFRKELVA